MTRLAAAPSVTRIVATLFVAVGGGVHLELWRAGYRGIAYIGPLFLANAIASAVVAAWLLLLGGRLSALVAVAISLGSLGGLVLSRTVGLFGFMESGWTVAASRAVAAEVGAIVTLGLMLAVRHRSRGSSAPLTAAPMPDTAPA